MTILVRFPLSDVTLLFPVRTSASDKWSLFVQQELGISIGALTNRLALKVSGNSHFQ
jgi:hypothetical protein